jgi:hypothetical protein
MVFQEALVAVEVPVAVLGAMAVLEELVETQVVTL